MTKTVILSDIHSNYEALTAVIQEAKEEGADEFICLGDIIGYGPNPNECVYLLRKYKMTFLLGNHEECLFSGIEREKMSGPAKKAINWTEANLGEEHIEYLFKNRPSTFYQFQQFSGFLAHASHRGDPIWDYITKEEEAEFEIEKAPPDSILMVGHTHSPFLYEKDIGLIDLVNNFRLKEGGTYLLNPGSVGQPRDGDCRASYMVIEENDKGTFLTINRVFYNIQKTYKKILNSDLPWILGERLFSGE